SPIALLCTSWSWSSSAIANGRLQIKSALMLDPIPAGFIDLSEAWKRTTSCVSEAHVESENLDNQRKIRSLESQFGARTASCLSEGQFESARLENQAEIQSDVEGSAAADSKSDKAERAGDEQDYPRSSPEAIFGWGRRNYAVTKL